MACAEKLLPMGEWL